MQTFLLESAVRATLIAAVIGLVLFVMRIKTASVLHAVWAAVVFLMMLLPAWVAWGPKASLPVLPPQAGTAIALVEQVPPPLPAGLEDRSPSPVRQSGGFSLREYAIPGTYLLGLFVLLLRLAIGTIRANRLASASCVVPVTVGLLRPRVILPESSRAWPQAQLEAVLTHEGEHVRRRDPLFQWLALLNRAVFWFHPLAWWLERRLSGLAEEACDAAVIAQGHDPSDYSEYLLDLARSVRRAGTRVNAVGMAMPGIGLKHRIRQMLSGVPVPRISRPRMACTVAVCATAAAILAAGTLVRAQSAAATLKFEVASIRLCDGGGGPNERGGGGTSSPGRLTLICQSVSGLIDAAYVIYANGVDAADPGLVYTTPVEGGPGWINSERYTINAKAEGNASEEMMQGPMLQSLLEDRFKLKIRRETREVPLYALIVAKGGPKLQPFKEGTCVLEVITFPPTPPPAVNDTACVGAGREDRIEFSIKRESR